MTKFRQLIESILAEYDSKKIFTKGDKHYNSSKDELYMYDLLKKKWPDTIMSYTRDDFINPNTNRHFQLDFYIPSLNMGIQLNKHWKHGRRKYDPNDKNCLADVRWLKSKDSDFYDKVLYTWTVLDPLKRDVAKNIGMNYVEIFNLEEFNKWYNNPDLTYEEYKTAPDSLKYNSEEYFDAKDRHLDIYGNDSDPYAA